jgi:hypothetical protein
MKQLSLFPELTFSAYPKTRLQAIIYYMAQLDADMIEDLLDDYRTYQDFPKYIFLHKLTQAFEQFQELGQRELKVYKGWCRGCSKGCGGYTFLAENGMFMDILFKTNGEEIEDIYECNMLMNENGKAQSSKLQMVQIDPVFDFSDDEDMPF